MRKCRSLSSWKGLGSGGGGAVDSRVAVRLFVELRQSYAVDIKEHKRQRLRTEGKGEREKGGGASEREGESAAKTRRRTLSSS